MTIPVKYTKLFINNAYVDSGSGKTFPTVDPATAEVIAQAVQAARAAFEGPWHSMGPTDRCKLMLKLADLMEANLDELARLETMDSGKPFCESRDYDVPSSIDCIRYYAGWTDKIYGQTIPSNGPYFSYTLHEPIGVVGAIIPWNFPISLLCWKIGPALATGNTIVIKPAEQTPLTAIRMGQLFAEAGFPVGVYNVVPGYGPITGAALCRHPGVDKIAFTGSGPTGRRIQQMCLESNLKRCTLELGGKSANIVFPDIDKDRMYAVVETCHTALFYNQGQVCCAGSRLFVHEDIYDEFVKMSVERAQLRTVGDPFDEGNEQGPQVSKDQFERVLRYIREGQAEGAKLQTGGEAAGEKGFFVQPTIFTDVTDDMKIAKEEIFGPVLCVFKFKDTDEVIRRANETPYGLAAAVWTSNIKTAQKVSRGLKAGTVWINTYGHVDHVAPFGGFKDSGVGRDLGSYALQHYTEVKTVVSAL